jgi:hypothetical protein
LYRYGLSVGFGNLTGWVGGKIGAIGAAAAGAFYDSYLATGGTGLSASGQSTSIVDAAGNVSCPNKEGTDWAKATIQEGGAELAKGAAQAVFFGAAGKIFEASGSASAFEISTVKDARYLNRTLLNVGRAEFEENLVAGGFTKSVKNAVNNVVTYEKGDLRYTVRDYARTYKAGPSVDVVRISTDKTILKYRLQ